MKHFVWLALGLLLVAGILSTAIASERLVLFEYLRNTGSTDLSGGQQFAGINQCGSPVRVHDDHLPCLVALGH